MTESPSLDAVTRMTDRLSAAYLEQYGLIPMARDEAGLLVATWREQLDDAAADDLELVFGAPFRLARMSEADIRSAIHRVYGTDAATAEALLAGIASEDVEHISADIPLDDLVSLANEAPVVKLVNFLLLEAIDARASDVHLEAYADALRVRYRLDGVLQPAPSPPPQLAAAVVSRLKIMADLDIAERRVPQDGRIRIRLQSRQVDVRVSTLPTLHGESVVLRLLDKERNSIGLGELGMAPDTLSAFTEVIARPHGIVLATGPTGSGKTTTLYAAIGQIRTGREKILTVEDPIEYELDGVPQVPVNEKVGVTFATALRALLRQDPDVMLVGEIRDADTAEIATQASLTGHLVLSTLHTNDAAGALTRLLELGVAPYLVASTVEAVLAQRLVRVTCTECAMEVRADAAWMGGASRAPITIRRGRGCASCRETGYRGRLGIYELLVVCDEIREFVMRRAPATEIRQVAIEHGMRTLRRDGARLVASGITTPDEVLRVTHE